MSLFAKGLLQSSFQSHEKREISLRKTDDDDDDKEMKLRH